MTKPKYDHNTFEEVFSEIAYAFEAQYPCYLEFEDGAWTFSVYKLTIRSTGTMNYKVSDTTFDPALWPRIHLLAKLLTKDPTFELLYVNE